MPFRCSHGVVEGLGGSQCTQCNVWPKDKASEAESLEKVLADYRELCKDVDCIDMAQGLIEAFVSQQRKQAAEEAIKAVTPEKTPFDEYETEKQAMYRYQRDNFRAEVIRRGQEHLDSILPK